MDILWIILLGNVPLVLLVAENVHQLLKHHALFVMVLIFIKLEQHFVHQLHASLLNILMQMLAQVHVKIHAHNQIFLSMLINQILKI